MSEELDYVPDKSRESFLIKDLVLSVPRRFKQYRIRHNEEETQWADEIAFFIEEKAHNMKEVREGW